jgi:hypothetical protein
MAYIEDTWTFLVIKQSLEKIYRENVFSIFPENCFIEQVQIIVQNMLKHTIFTN